MFFLFHIRRVFLLLIIVPSPEHGASRRILSALNSKDLIFLQNTSLGDFVIIAFMTPHLSRFEARIFILPRFISFAIKIPEFFIPEAICVVLLPGDAHKSITISFSFGLREIIGSILEISWI